MITARINTLYLLPPYMTTPADNANAMYLSVKNNYYTSYLLTIMLIINMYYELLNHDLLLIYIIIIFTTCKRIHIDVFFYLYLAKENKYGFIMSKKPFMYYKL